jgi:hypothetical protein
MRLSMCSPAVSFISIPRIESGSGESGRVDYLGGKDWTWCSENEGRMTVRRARMLGSARPADELLSRQSSAPRCHEPALAACALKWFAMASAIVTKLPLNMLTPDLQPVTLDLKTHGARAIRPG